MRISDWSSDVCSSDLDGVVRHAPQPVGRFVAQLHQLCRLGSETSLIFLQLGGYDLQYGFQRLGLDSHRGDGMGEVFGLPPRRPAEGEPRSEEHTSELQSLMRNSYAAFCWKKNKHQTQTCKEI